MLVNGNFDSPLVADAAFAERARTPHEHTAAVAQLAVEGFDDAGAGLADDVGSYRQYLPLGPPLVGEVARVGGSDAAMQPTNVHISSNSRSFPCRRCTRFGRRRGRAGAGRNASFYPFGNRVARHARGAGCAAEGVALGQQLVDLGILPGLFHDSGLEIALVAVRFALVLGPPAAVAIAPNLLTGALSAIMLGKEHDLKLLHHPKLTHYPHLQYVFIATAMNLSRIVN